MGRICKICTSRNCLEYDSMRLDGVPIKNIHTYSSEKYNEGLGYHNFQTHFQFHLKPYINQQTKLSKLRVELITEIDSQLEILGEMRNNLFSVREALTKSAKLSNIVKKHLIKET